MNLTFLIIAAVLLCCFFAAYLWFAVINRRLNDISFGSPFFGNVFFPVWLVAFAGCTALYFLLPEQNDQLFDISFLNVAAAFISAACTHRPLELCPVFSGGNIKHPFAPSGFYAF